MQYRFANAVLERLYYEDLGGEAYPEGVVSAFFKKMQIIHNAKSVADLRAIKGNHFEKLEAQENSYSIRLNERYRLIFGLEKDGSFTIVEIREISNHYE